MVNELLLTNTQVSKFCKTFENGSLTNIKLSKYQLHKIGHQEDFQIGFYGVTKNWFAFNQKCFETIS